jgi:hypothetical protein
MFESRGVQPGEPLPALPVVDLDGAPVNLANLQAGRPMALVTASLTCNVARSRQPRVDAIAEEFRGRAAVNLLYNNRRDGVLVRQPVTLGERLALARPGRLPTSACSWTPAGPCASARAGSTRRRCGQSFFSCSNEFRQARQ